MTRRHPLAPPRQGPTGAWRGRVTRTDSSGRAWVTVPRLTGVDVEYGPCPTLEGPYVLAGTTTGAGGDPTHDHGLTVAPLAKGDAVLVTFLEGRPDDPVVLGRLL